MRRASLRTALAIATVLILSGCGGEDRLADQPVPDAVTDEIAPGKVTPAEAATLAAAGVSVIDVRTPEEFAGGHLEAATLVDFYDETFADQIAALDPGGDYLVYCRSGNRSGQAVALMQQLGFEQVYDLDGGVVAYEAAGLPLVD